MMGDGKVIAIDEVDEQLALAKAGGAETFFASVPPSHRPPKPVYCGRLTTSLSARAAGYAQGRSYGIKKQSGNVVLTASHCRGLKLVPLGPRAPLQEHPLRRQLQASACRALRMSGA